MSRPPSKLPSDHEFLTLLVRKRQPSRVVVAIPCRAVAWHPVDQLDSGQLEFLFLRGCEEPSSRSRHTSPQASTEDRAHTSANDSSGGSEQCQTRHRRGFTPGKTESGAACRVGRDRGSEACQVGVAAKQPAPWDDGRDRKGNPRDLEIRKFGPAMKCVFGTPVENRLLDLWNLCDVLQRGLLGSAKEFAERFEKPQGEGDQDKRLLDLKKTLFQQPHAFLLRRTKSQVTDLPPKNIIRLDCSMSEEEIALHQVLLRGLRSEVGRNRFLSALHRFAQLYQHPALLGDDAEDRTADELVRQSSKLRVLLATLHQIRGRRQKAIVFARHRATQGILAKVLQEEFHLPVRIINGDTKLRAGSLKASGVKTGTASCMSSGPNLDLTSSSCLHSWRVSGSRLSRRTMWCTTDDGGIPRWSPRLPTALTGSARRRTSRCICQS
jgi:hypothetical protein